MSLQIITNLKHKTTEAQQCCRH